jgi:branched-chain amino acid transport system ATP-binding protein
LRLGGLSILLIEQNAELALSIADVGYVLESGRIALSGPGPELLRDDNVQRVYLGV